MARSKVVSTCKLQLTVDVATDRLIGDMTTLGIHGTNKSEVACSIIRMWLWENQTKLRENGVSLKFPPAKQVSMVGNDG